MQSYMMCWSTFCDIQFLELCSQVCFEFRFMTFHIYFEAKQEMSLCFFVSRAHHHLVSFIFTQTAYIKKYLHQQEFSLF